MKSGVLQKIWVVGPIALVGLGSSLEWKSRFVPAYHAVFGSFMCNNDSVEMLLGHRTNRLG